MNNYRINNLIKIMVKAKTDCIILTPGSNFYYYTDIPIKQTERLVYFLVFRNSKRILIMPEVEKNMVKKDSSTDMIFYNDKDGININEILKSYSEINVEKIGIDRKNIKLMDLDLISDSEVRASFIDISTLLKEVRMKKELGEIESIKRAIKIMEMSLSTVLTKIEEGVTEKYIAALLEFEMKKNGVEGTPFETIVASGYRSSLPHGRASNKVIRKNDVIVIDFGAYLNGYVGDMTRTVFLGGITKHQEEVYNVVREAQETAITSLKKGVICNDVDFLCRSIIEEKGYGKYFTHRTGHGIGLEPHEEPFIQLNNHTSLQEGMVFTVEPGIYIPNEFGVRIEDNLLITDKSFQNLMSFSKEITIL